MRFLLVDRIEELKHFEYALGTKCISLADDAFEHHFPGQPASGRPESVVQRLPQWRWSLGR